MRDHRIESAPRDVTWRDLVVIGRWQFLIELALPLPWLALSLALYASPVWPLGALASFMFFLCCLRLNHEAIHGNLRLARRWDHVVMRVLSALMLGSNHADAWCHLRHHADTLGTDDHEGNVARKSLWAVLLYGPRFPFALVAAAWAEGGKVWRGRVLGDLAAIGAMLALIAWLNAPALWLHVLAMAAGQCLTAFFAVWITHHDTLAQGLAGRSQRGPLAVLSYHMFYHREHHLFPLVPVSNLPELARRLDREVPGYAAAHRPVVGVLEAG